MNQARMRHHQAAPTAIAIVALFTANGGCASEGSVSTAEGKALSADHPRPPRPTTKNGCDACGGLWGVHGIEQIESCICRTSDGGEACRDGSECDGVCLVDDRAQFEVVSSDPPVGSFVGVCSDYNTVFDCYRILPPGSSTREPLPEEDAADDICVDSKP